MACAGPNSGKGPSWMRLEPEFPVAAIQNRVTLTHFCPPFQHLLSERRQSLGQQILERWAKIGCENATV